MKILEAHSIATRLLIMTVLLFSAWQPASAFTQDDSLQSLIHYDWRLHSIQNQNAAPRTASHSGIPLASWTLKISPKDGGLFGLQASSICASANHSSSPRLPVLSESGEALTARFLANKRITQLSSNQDRCGFSGDPRLPSIACLPKPRCNDPRKGRAEAEYYRYLNQLSGFNQRGHVLTLHTRSGDILTFRGTPNEFLRAKKAQEALAQQPKPGLDKLLAWPKWQLTSIQQPGRQAITRLKAGFPVSDSHISFYNDRGIARFGIRRHCNGLGGLVKLGKPDRIHLANGMSTMIGCQTKLMQADSELGYYFQSVNRYRVRGNQLQLITRQGYILNLRGIR